MRKKLIRKIINKLVRFKIILKLMRIINEVIQEEKLLRSSEPFLGFHGDQYLLNIVNFLIQKCKNFVETGTRRGDTLKYVADGYKHLNLYSCEPDESNYLIAEKKVKNYKNCKVFNQISQIFIPKILNQEKFKEDLTFFFLDAHGKGYEWPLKLEVSQITQKLNKAIILIDDFKVPNNTQFGYDVYDNQECSMSFIQENLNLKRKYMFIYPKYKVKTSNHDRFRGYIIILMGLDIEELNIPKSIFENYSLIKQ